MEVSRANYKSINWNESHKHVVSAELMMSQNVEYPNKRQALRWEARRLFSLNFAQDEDDRIEM